MLNGLLARKLGMTQVFLPDGTFVPVTVLETGPCFVVQRRTVDNDGYSAVQLGFMDQKPQRVSNPLRQHFAKAGLEIPKRHLREFRVDPEAQLEPGQEIKVADVFNAGDIIKVSAKSKGRGFAGTIKRHNFHRGPTSHGSRNVREPGSIGTSATPARVGKGRKMPGQMGNKMVTIRNLEVVEVDTERNLLLVKGAVPGSVHSLIIVKK